MASRLTSLTTVALDFCAGNVCHAGLAFGDVDNDGGAEFAIGSISGELAVFKGTEPSPWCALQQLGSISALAIGPLGRSPRNRLVALTAEGITYVVDVHSNADGSASCSERAHVLPPHATCALLADIFGDGVFHLVVALDAEMLFFRPAEQGDELQCVTRIPLHADTRSLSLCKPLLSAEASTCPPTGALIYVGSVDGDVLVVEASSGGAATVRTLASAQPGEGGSTIVLGGLGWPAAAAAKVDGSKSRALGDGAADDGSSGEDGTEPSAQDSAGGEGEGERGPDEARVRVPAVAIARNGSVTLVRADSGEPLTELLALGEPVAALHLRPAPLASDDKLSRSSAFAAPGQRVDRQDELVVCTGSGLVLCAADGEQLSSNLRCQLAACAAGDYALAPQPPSAQHRSQPAPDDEPRGTIGSGSSTSWCLAYVVAATNELFLAYSTLEPAPEVTSLLELLRPEQPSDGAPSLSDEEIALLVREALAAARRAPCVAG